MGASPGTLRDLVAAIDSGKAPSEVGHCKNARLERYLPELLADVAFPDYQWLDTFTHTGLWLAPAAKRSPLHCDFAHNLNAQIVGAKRFQLCPPEALSTRHVLRRNYRAIFANVDFEVGRSSRSGALLPHYEVVLEPGDILFIPYGWWHNVESLMPSVSVTRFWNTAPMLAATVSWWLTRSSRIHRFVSGQRTAAVAKANIDVVV